MVTAIIMTAGTKTRLANTIRVRKCQFCRWATNLDGFWVSPTLNRLETTKTSTRTPETCLTTSKIIQHSLS